MDASSGSDINNSLFIEGGVGLTMYGTVKNHGGTTGFAFLVDGRWDFQLNKEWTLFGELGFGYNAVSGVDTGDVTGGGLFPAIGAGAMYNFAPEWAIRADLSYQFFGAGVVYRF